MTCNSLLVDVKGLLKVYQTSPIWYAKQCSLFSLIHFINDCTYKNKDCIFRHRCQFMCKVRDWLR